MSLSVALIPRFAFSRRLSRKTPNTSIISGFSLQFGWFPNNFFVFVDILCFLWPQRTPLFHFHSFDLLLIGLLSFDFFFIRLTEMSSGDCTVQPINSQDLSLGSFGKLDKVSLSIVGTSKDVVVNPRALFISDEGTNSLWVVNLNLEVESGGLTPIDSKTQKNEGIPLGFADDLSSPHTPVEGVFDPFAPGPDNLGLAPHCRKFSSKSMSIIVRRLDFDSPIKEFVDNCLRNDALSVSDEDILEAFYTSLLETIVSKQKESFISHISNLNEDYGDCKTPPLSPRRICGALETCPGAPHRSSGTSRNIDVDLCRKIQFSP